MKILQVAGARPNFVKIAPLHRAFMQYPDMHPQIVHTGQHYDFAMSGVFFEQLGIPHPDHFLGVGQGSPTVQTAEIMCAFERVMRVEMPDLVLVVGDVTSTLACALVAAQMRIPLVHVEAGLRSRDRTMPEEMNRILTDALSDQLFVTEQAGMDNLLRENIDPGRIHLVGNVMIDSLVRFRDRIEDMSLSRQLGIGSEPYLLITMHRPGNVDHEDGLRKIAEMLEMLAMRWMIVFVVHPRTARNMADFGLDLQKWTNVKILPPQGYIEFLSLMRHSTVVITDSGGVQEETTFLGIHCITLRNNTERPVTVGYGTNYLLPDFNAQKVWDTIGKILARDSKKQTIPPLWDGNTAQRIVNILREKYIDSQDR
ncbi:UDP-N-acetylglucosamine 2-epimerase (non-hydrolysing) [Dyadobacter sp. SG02]|uniref:non-hydrolyzing UDP-N-acetylglucosamine 2-epimerase n=1 Tax=Dyadobacter sp. SG02 TaxID=1855291 RepID=UPI0008B4458B|nr:UDP-N-acetylglucosamine 2-epimerase (non-hydrolyzing) [Dyadobacter sp. SG02]SEI45585.1 UDP-N-acetylglucosamine 2-epimerase (non-hydrolysing) [Dyadobacter sp. SG02]